MGFLVPRVTQLVSGKAGSLSQSQGLDPLLLCSPLAGDSIFITGSIGSF